MPNTPVRAAATGLPEIARRGFLRGLAHLPLIGGGVAIIGSPVKADVPITDELLNTYEQWLTFEQKMLQHEIYGPNNGDNGRDWALSGWKYHFPPQPDGGPFMGWDKVPAPLMPSARAAVVLSAVGCFERAAENFRDRREIANVLRALRCSEERNA